MENVDNYQKDVTSRLLIIGNYSFLLSYWRLILYKYLSMKKKKTLTPSLLRFYNFSLSCWAAISNQSLLPWYVVIPKPLSVHYLFCYIPLLSYILTAYSTPSCFPKRLLNSHFCHFNLFLFWNLPIQPLLYTAYTLALVLLRSCNYIYLPSSLRYPVFHAKLFLQPAYILCYVHLYFQLSTEFVNSKSSKKQISEKSNTLINRNRQNMLK